MICQVWKIGFFFKDMYLRASWSTPPERGFGGVAIRTNPNSVITVVSIVVAAAVVSWLSSKRWQWLLLLMIFKLVIRNHHLFHHPHLWRHPLHWTTVLSSCLNINFFFHIPNYHLKFTAAAAVVVFCRWVIPWSAWRNNLLISLN